MWKMGDKISLVPKQSVTGVLAGLLFVSAYQLHDWLSVVFELALVGPHRA